MVWKRENRHMLTVLSCLSVSYDTSYIITKSLILYYDIDSWQRESKNQWLKGEDILWNSESSKCYLKVGDIHRHSGYFGNMRRHYQSMGGICRGASASLTTIALWFWFIRDKIV